MKFLILALLLAISTSDLQAQIFKRTSGSGYTTTSNGYYYRGKEYVRGRDLPDNPKCPCPMCVDLVQAYYAARQPKTVQAEPPKESASTKLIGTPQDSVSKVVDVFQIKDKDFVLLDPGCGDARILIDAVERYGCRGVGIEINTDTYNVALAEVRKAGLQDRIVIHNGDSRDYDFSPADGVVMFLFPDLISDLTKKFDVLKSGAKVVSYSHEIPLEGTLQCEDCYVWTKR